jgi:hypothetical protein
VADGFSMLGLALELEACSGARGALKGRKHQSVIKERNMSEMMQRKETWDFYFRAPGSLVVLSFPQLVSFSSVFPKPLSETVTSAGTAGCPTVEHL